MTALVPNTREQREAMLPAVTAQIFVSSTEARDLIDGVRNALSMKNVTWQECGANIDAALTYLAGVESGHILLVEKDRPLSEFLVALELLAAKCGSQTRVFVIGRGGDEPDPVAAYRSMLEVGVTDFILLPASPARLFDSLVAAFLSESRPKLGTSTAFIGAGSGSGSSTVAQNVGFAMAHVLVRDTLLVDLDPQYGTLAINFNLVKPRDLLAIEHTPGSIDHRVLWQSAERVDPHLKVLPTLPDLNHVPDLAKSISCAVLEIPFQRDVHVVIDVPDAWTETKREMLRRVDRVVVIAEPTLSGVQNLGNTKRVLERMEVDLDKVALVLNRVNQPGRTEVPIKEIEAATGFVGLAVLPYDARLLGEADAAGVLPLALSEKRPFSRAVIGLARELSGIGAADMPSLMMLLRRRLRAWW